jgi:hypothetical protein
LERHPFGAQTRLGRHNRGAGQRLKHLLSVSVGNGS